MQGNILSCFIACESCLTFVEGGQFYANRSDPPDLDSALKCIKSAREAELEALNSQSTGKAVASEQASKALKHLMLYVNTSTLYEVALGLYDLELAYMVVTNAQVKDLLKEKICENLLPLKH